MRFSIPGLRPNFRGDLNRALMRDTDDVACLLVWDDAAVAADRADVSRRDHYALNFFICSSIEA
jgi:hypothetical protein